MTTPQLKTIVVGDMTYSVLRYADLNSLPEDKLPECVLIDSDVVETIIDLVDFYCRTSSGPRTASFSDHNAIFIEDKLNLRVVFPPGTMTTLYRELSIFHVIVGDAGGNPLICLISDDDESESVSLAYSSGVGTVSDETAQEWISAQEKVWRADGGGT